MSKFKTTTFLDGGSTLEEADSVFVSELGIIIMYYVVQGSWLVQYVHLVGRTLEAGVCLLPILSLVPRRLRDTSDQLTPDGTRVTLPR
jgi:hypothetical protein